MARSPSSKSSAPPGCAALPARECGDGSIASAYDPERFRREGHKLIDAVADALHKWQRRDGAALPWRVPDDAVADWALAPGHADLVDELGRIIAGSTALHHPHCMAHQVPAPLPGAALAELVSAVVNNGMAVYEVGPAPVAIELAVVRWMCRKLGFGDTSGGVLTSGGSLGNLTALLAMRQVKAGYDAWREGTHNRPPLAVITSADAHYSITRALSIMGWGEGGAIAAPVDARHRLTAVAVTDALRQARARGIHVIGIVAAAGSTATGAFDPLDEVADVAAREQLWLHVDAAHGGAVALSAQHRHKINGIARADSVVWDAHKLLMMPALITAVVFKHGAHSYESFAQQASYMYPRAAADLQWWNLGTRTLECTKRMMAVKLWCSLRVHGESLFGDIVDRLFVLASALADKVNAASEFELALEPEANIVCYRHRPHGIALGQALDSHNRSLRQRIIESGKYYVVGTQLESGYYLRSALMNPLVETKDFDGLIDHIRDLCRS